MTNHGQTLTAPATETIRGRKFGISDAMIVIIGIALVLAYDKRDFIGLVQQIEGLCRTIAAYFGYHVHVSAYREQNGEFTSFHVKFDPGAAHISWFYAWSSHGRYDHAGQSVPDQKAIIKTFADRDKHPPMTLTTPGEVDTIYQQLVDKSEAVAAVVAGDLG